MIDANTAKSAVRLEALVRSYGVDLKPQGKEMVACCPFHQERTPSFTVTPATQLAKCFGCGWGGDALEFVKTIEGVSFQQAVSIVADAAGLIESGSVEQRSPAMGENRETRSVAVPPTPTSVEPAASAKLVAVYPYTDANGELLYEVLRYEPKTFKQRKPNGAWGIADVERVLYRLPQVVAADTVLICEGEKDVATCEAAGFVATTNSGGANGKWTPAMIEALRGKHLVILPDQDEPGKKRGLELSAMLRPVAASIVEVHVPIGKDVTDYVDADGDLTALIQTAVLQARRDDLEREFTGPEEILWLAGGPAAFLEKQEPGVATGFRDYDYMTGGLYPGEMTILAARPSMGKAQPLYSSILTVNGWIEMRDAQVGVRLASPDGVESEITGVFPQGEKPIVRVTFSDGRYADCCTDHLWSVMYRDWSSPRVVTTSRLIEMLSKKRYSKRLWVDLYRGEHGKEINLPVHPWLLGALIGDGGLTGSSVKFSKEDRWVVDRVRALIPDDCRMTFSDRVTWRVATKTNNNCKSSLALALDALGLMGKKSYEKMIPLQYLDAPNEARYELLRGLMDTDGTVEPDGTLRYSTTSPVLAEQVQYLFRSLGAISEIKIRRPKYRYKGELKEGRVEYRVSALGCDRSQFVTRPFHLNRIKNDRSSRLTIRSIEPLGKMPAQCISVSHPEGLYITDEFIVTHNTALCMNIAEHVARHRGPVAVFSVEMSKRSLLTRMVAARAHVTTQDLRRGTTSPDDRRRLQAALGEIVSIPLYLDDTGGLTVALMREKLARFKRLHGMPVLVVIDYLQLMACDKPKENRNQEVSAISRGVKLTLKELNVPGLVLAQLSRASEARADRTPQLSDLRDSGSIEQDADVVALIHREEYYKRDDPQHKGLADVIIAKQRNGPVGKVELGFVGKFTQFVNLERYREEAA